MSLMTSHITKLTNSCTIAMNKFLNRKMANNNNNNNDDGQIWTDHRPVAGCGRWPSWWVAVASAAGLQNESGRWSAPAHHSTHLPLRNPTCSSPTYSWTANCCCLPLGCLCLPCCRWKFQNLHAVQWRMMWHVTLHTLIISLELNSEVVSQLLLLLLLRILHWEIHLWRYVTASPGIH